MGEIVSGDVDDWILARLNIPSVTAELGTEADYQDFWQNRNKEEAMRICEDNQAYLRYTF